MSASDRAADPEFPHETLRLHAVERFVEIVRRGIKSPEDPKTLAMLAAAGGTSRSPLKLLCNVLVIQPRDGRDFVRLFRACLMTTGDPVEFHNLLHIADRGTMARLFSRAGLEYPSMPLPLEFLERQCLVRNQLVLNALKRLLRERPDLSRRQDFLGIVMPRA